MIDTIALVLNQTDFKIVQHEKFSPSTEGLYSKYYRLGGRSNLACFQNPTSLELRNGIYKPRLTATKRIQKFHDFEINLKIEFSVPKLLFGNNFDELEDTDFNLVVSKLHNGLRDMGVIASEAILANSLVSAIHFSKNIPLTDYTTPYTYLERLYRINLNQRLDLNQTDFRNEGHSLKFRANSFEIAFYDKLKDLRKAKISDKRAEERDNAIQTKLFKELPLSKPFEVLRMEVRLNRRQKLKQVLKSAGISVEPTFKELFSKQISKKILLYYFDSIEKSYPLLSIDEKDAKTFLSEFLICNPKAGIKKAVQMLGLRTAIRELGVREFREVVGGHGKANWYRLNQEMQSFSYPGQDTFKVIRHCLEENKSLKLIDFLNKDCIMM